jgi:hypothetical protein
LNEGKRPGHGTNLHISKSSREEKGEANIRLEMTDFDCQ